MGSKAGRDYYNEIDKHTAAWLRQLIADGHLPDGDVDERSIEDVLPSDLAGYRRCHFFAGIGGWALALELAGWPDDRPVWTGSCPCQPFSAAGAGAGFADERHLWPAWQHLIAQCKPPVVFGEQVASAAVGPWVDLVQADLEGMGYAFGGIAFPVAGIGAPHLRDRTYWGAHRLGHADLEGLEGFGLRHRQSLGHGPGAIRPAAEAGEPCGLAEHDRDGRGALPIGGLHHAEHHAEPCGRDGGMADPHGQPEGVESEGLPARKPEPCGLGGAGGLGNADSEHAGRDAGAAPRSEGGACVRPSGDVLVASGAVDRPGPLHGFWAAADWLFCRDGKWRPVEPGTFPLAHGLPARVVRLRGYGNAIVPAQAAEFILAFDEAIRG